MGKQQAGIFTSTDGVTWINVSPSRRETLYGVAYGNGRFIAVGEKGMLWSSVDGLLWTVAQLVSGKTLWDVQYNGSSFLAVGDSGTAVFSADGVNWQDKSLTDANTTTNGVSWFKDIGGSGLTVLNGKWTVMTSWGYADESGRILWASDTANSWSIVSGTYFDFDYIPLKLTSVGGGSTALVFPLQHAQPKFRFSSDGLVWTEKVLGPASAGSLRGGAEGGGRIVLVGEKGQIFTTADGIPALAQQPRSQSVTVSQPTTLQVVAYATGPFSYQWRKNGQPIGGATGPTLRFPATTLSDAADYTVVVTNARGFTISSVATLSVVPALVAPAISLQPVAQAVTAGAAVVLSVGASGYPPPTYQWQKAGVAIPGATNATLTLNNAQAGDAGSYTVVVTNASGSVTSNVATLTVNVPPGITSQPSAQAVTIGGSVSFTVVANGTAPLTSDLLT